MGKIVIALIVTLSCTSAYAQDYPDKAVGHVPSAPNIWGYQQPQYYQQPQSCPQPWYYPPAPTVIPYIPGQNGWLMERTWGGDYIITPR